MFIEKQPSELALTTQCYQRWRFVVWRTRWHVYDLPDEEMSAAC